MLNKTIAFLLVFLLAFPSYVLAEPPEEGPKVYSIKKNEKAPFAGVIGAVQGAVTVPTTGIDLLLMSNLKKPADILRKRGIV